MLVCLLWSGNLQLFSLTSESHYASPRVLWAARCIQQIKLLFLWHSHPWVPPDWPYCQKAQCGRWFTVKHSKAVEQTSSHPQNSASHLLGLQGPQQTPAQNKSFKVFFKHVTFLELTGKKESVTWSDDRHTWIVGLQLHNLVDISWAEAGRFGYLLSRLTETLLLLLQCINKTIRP